MELGSQPAGRGRCDSSPGILHPPLEPTTEEGHGPDKAVPEESHEDDRGQEHLSYEERQR